LLSTQRIQEAHRQLHISMRDEETHAGYREPINMARIHFHSDCSFFAGCEFMLANFFNTPSFLYENRVSFTFRDNRDYEKGFRERVHSPIQATPLHLYDIYDYYQQVDRRFESKSIRKIIKIGLNLILLKYIFIILNTAIIYRYFKEQKRIDILHINNGGYPGAYSTISAVIAAKLAGIPIIVYVVNNIAAGYWNPERWLDLPFDIVVKRWVTVFITGSNFARDALQKTLKIPPEHMITINNGISIKPVSETKEEVAQRYNFPQNRIIIAIVANLEERKGHIYLLEAIKTLKESKRLQSIPFLAIVSGPGNQRSVLENYITDHNLHEDVAFYNFEPHLSNLLNATDIIVLPSIASEDFPNVTLEAMAFGKAIIASKFSGIQEQIIDGKSGLLVPPKDNDAIADAICILCENQKLREKLGDSAKTRFYSKFTAERSVNIYLALYKKLLAEKT